MSRSGDELILQTAFEKLCLFSLIQCPLQYIIGHHYCIAFNRFEKGEIVFLISHNAVMPPICSKLEGYIQKILNLI